MIAIAAAAALGIAVLALVSLRLAARHSERRSVRNYERAVGALGNTSRRTDRGLVPRPGGKASAPAHVRTGRAELPPPRRPDGAAPGVAHVRLRPPVQPSSSEAGRATEPTRVQTPAGQPKERPPSGEPGERPARPAAPRPAASRRVFGPLPPERPAAAGTRSEPALPAARSTPGGTPGEPQTELVPRVVRDLAAASAGLDELVARSRLARDGEPDPELAPLEDGDGPEGDLHVPGHTAGGAAAEVPGTLRDGDAVPESARATARLDLRGLVARRGVQRSGGRAGRAALLNGNGAGLRTSVPESELEPDGDVSTAWARSAAAPPEVAAGAVAAEVGDALAGASGAEMAGDEPVPGVFDFDEPAEPAEPPSPPIGVRPIRGLRPPGEQRQVLRLATGAAAVVAVAALGVGVWELATRTSPQKPAAGSTAGLGSSHHHVGGTVGGSTGRAHKAKGSATPTTRPTPSTVPSTVVAPVSTSPTLVVYHAPAGSYTLHFAVSAGECWVGAHAGAVWTWQATVLPASPASLTASGTEVIRIGAPSVVSITLGSKPVSLPKQSQPYDVEFSPTAA